MELPSSFLYCSVLSPLLLQFSRELSENKKGIVSQWQWNFKDFILLLNNTLILIKTLQSHIFTYLMINSMLFYLFGFLNPYDMLMAQTGLFFSTSLHLQSLYVCIYMHIHTLYTYKCVLNSCAYCYLHILLYSSINIDVIFSIFIFIYISVYSDLSVYVQNNKYLCKCFRTFNICSYCNYANINKIILVYNLLYNLNIIYTKLI